MRIDRLGNIGVGITTPLNTLHLNNPSAAGDTPRIQFTNTNTGTTSTDGSFVGISNQNQLDIWNFENSVVRVGTNSTERMRIDASGNLGLGITPSAWSGSGSVLQTGSFALHATPGGGTDTSTFVTNAFYNGTNWIYRTGPASATRYDHWGGQHRWLNAPSGTAGANATFTQAMTLDGSGNLGVGLTNPSVRLDVSGSIRSTQSITISNGGGTYQAGSIYSDANWGMLFRAAQANPATAQFGWKSSDDASEFMRISLTGNVGIGTTTTSRARLSVVTGVAATPPALGSATGSSLFVGGAEVNYGLIGGVAGAGYVWLQSQRVDGTATAYDLNLQPTGGNVGIGTTSPGYKLQVNGSFAATTKSFLIDHPTKEGMKLRYGSLESPYHGVRLTGEAEVVNSICTVKLPDYICDLCKQEGSQVQITNIRHGKVLWVDSIDIDNNVFTIATEETGNYRFYWSFTAIRKDIEDMVVEFEE
jgi:hypothetical protein